MPRKREFNHAIMIRITKEMRLNLDRVAMEEHQPVGNLVRLAIDRWLDAYAGQKDMPFASRTAKGKQ